MSTQTLASNESATTKRARAGGKPPTLDGGLPWLGRMLDFRRNPIALLTEAYEKHGEIVGVPLVGNELIFLASPDLQEVFYRAPDDVVSQKEAYKFTVPVFGEGVCYDAEPEIMMEQIGFAIPALRDAAMRTYAPKLAEETRKFIADWGDEGEIDILDVMKELTTYSSSRCLLGEEFRDAIGAEFARLYDIVEKGVNQIAFFWPNAPLPSFRRRDEARGELGKLLRRVIDNRRAKGIRDNGILQAFMDAHYKSGRALTDDEITGLILVVMFAGHHTSSVTACWTGVELLRHPHTLKPVREELDRVFADGREVSFQTMRECERLEWAIKETLRLHPPLIMLMRKLLKDFEIGGYTIPAGGMLLASPAATGRLPTFFEDPHRFDPERFSEEREEEMHPYAWTPFGGGRHRCLGAVFAMLQIKTVWATLFLNYDFELVEAQYPPDYAAMVVGPKHPARFRYRRRRR
ncbi:MAG: cytochrome P450 [Myxococcales bacterium]|nr:cytochrome P450 [Myxococcales bacterium]